jgi:hypothetical protein
MRYREHRGSLQESMQTVIEIASKEELIQHLNKRLQGRKEIRDISFQHAVYDTRIDWDTWYVIVHFEDDEKPQIMGMSDSKF